MRGKRVRFLRGHYNRMVESLMANNLPVLMTWRRFKREWTERHA
jgi:hypothetical protein